MYVSNDSYITQNGAFSNTGKIRGVYLPDFNDVYVYTKKESGTNDSEYENAIVKQAIKDHAAGKFQNESQGFNNLAKRYVSEVSPDRKNIITAGLQQIAKNNVKEIKSLDLIALLFDGEVKYKKDVTTVNYAEFRDSNGEMVAKYSNGGWTMLNTEAETARHIEMCSIYNEAWNTAAKASQDGGNVSNGYTSSVGNSENTVDMLA